MTDTEFGAGEQRRQGAPGGHSPSQAELGASAADPQVAARDRVERGVTTQQPDPADRQRRAAGTLFEQRVFRMGPEGAGLGREGQLPALPGAIVQEPARAPLETRESRRATLECLGEGGGSGEHAGKTGQRAVGARWRGEREGEAQKARSECERSQLLHRGRRRTTRSWTPAGETVTST